MGVSSGVEHDGVEVSLRLLNPSDEFAFHIGLTELHFGSELGGSLPNPGLNIRESRSTVSLRFPLAQKIQVRSVQEEDLHSAQSTLARLSLSMGYHHSALPSWGWAKICGLRRATCPRRGFFPFEAISEMIGNPARKNRSTK